jgi:Bacterial transferase hexapeptide (six repeats)
VSRIAPTAWIAPTAVISGDVTIGAGSRVLHGAVVTGDSGPVEIGSDVLVMENAVLRGRVDHPLREPLDFPGTMYGLPRGTSMREIMRRQSERYGAADPG